MDFPPGHRMIPEISDRVSSQFEKSSRNPQMGTDPSRKSAGISRCLEGQAIPNTITKDETRDVNRDNRRRVGLRS